MLLFWIGQFLQELFSSCRVVYILCSLFNVYVQQLSSFCLVTLVVTAHHSFLLDWKFHQRNLLRWQCYLVVDWLYITFLFRADRIRWHAARPPWLFMCLAWQYDNARLTHSQVQSRHVEVFRWNGGSWWSLLGRSGTGTTCWWPFYKISSVTSQFYNSTTIQNNPSTHGAAAQKRTETGTVKRSLIFDCGRGKRQWIKSQSEPTSVLCYPVVSTCTL